LIGWNAVFSECGGFAPGGLIFKVFNEGAEGHRDALTALAKCKSSVLSRLPTGD